MLVFSCGGTIRSGSATFMNEAEASKFIFKKRFEGYLISNFYNKIYNTHIIFYMKQV